ncbi:hypothetical protein PVAG01_07529 [Phlyctema vagabunda]|uniref:Cep57 centrosome microtubule-binding domain-containing protein n=1 Tax=Phlyctema vagabunda TaxID=108571 RepID=A0ABR4PCP2_9HELO
MATLSMDARIKARQIRDMSRQLNGDHSVASSTGSQHGTISPDSTFNTTTTDFDPVRDGAEGSTGLLQQDTRDLPRMRDTARKYNRWQPRSQQITSTYNLNTSALDRAFPDFDSGPYYHDEPELGRGAKARQRSPGPTRAPLAEFSDNIGSPLVNVGECQILYTPNGKSSRTQKEQQNFSGGLRMSARWIDQNMRPNSPTLASQIMPDVQQVHMEPNSSPFVSTPSENLAQSRVERNTNQASSKSRFSHATSQAEERQERVSPSYSGLKKPSPSRNSSAGNGQPANYVGQKSRTAYQARVRDESESSFMSQRSSDAIAIKNTRFPTANEGTNTNTFSLGQQYTAEDFDVLRDVPSKPPAAKQPEQQGLKQSYVNTNTTPTHTQHSFALPQQMGDVSKLVSIDTQKSSLAVPKMVAGKGRSFSADFARTKKPSKDLIDEAEQDEEIDIYWKCQMLQKQLDEIKELRNGDQALISDLKTDRYALETEIETLEVEKEKGFRKDSGVGGVGSLSSSSDGVRNIHFSEVCQQKDHLETELKTFRERLATSREAASKMEAKLETRLSKQETQLTKITEERDEIRFQRDQAVYQLERATEDAQRLKGDNTALESATEDLNLNISNLEQHITVLKSEMSKTHYSNGQLKTEQRTLLTEKEAWLHEKIAMKREIDTLKKDLQSARDEISQYRDEHRDSSRLWQQKSREWITKESKFEKKIQRLEAAFTRLGKSVSNSPQKSTPFGDDTTDKDFEISEFNDTHDTNFSEELRPFFGPGYLAKRKADEQAKRDKEEQIKQQLEELERETAKDAIMRDDTIQSEGSVHSVTSKRSVRSGKNFDDDTRSVVSNRSERANSIRSERSDRSSYSKKEESSREKSTKFVGLDNTQTTEGESVLEQETVRSVGSARSVRSVKAPESGRPGILKKTGTYQETRHNQVDDDLTSAFIIPDIIATAKQNTRPVLSSTARDVLDGLCQHNSQNCTICTRVAIRSGKADADALDNIRIEKSIPVSQRTPKPEPYEDEPTLRPTMAPSLALDTVIKAIRDEIDHLRMKHARLQAKYDERDSSLNRKARKALFTELQEVALLRDAKADQLYTLFDVVEARENLDLDLPWEGLEDTN